MKFFRSFHGSISTNDYSTRILDCYENIKRIISKHCTISHFIENENWIAFSGNLQNPELQLTIYTIKSSGKYYLSADLDDEISWHEWDYTNQDEFENAVAEYISPFINRTIKTVTEKKKHKHIKTSRYFLDNDNKWTLIDQDIIDFVLIRLFITKDSTKEEVKSYQIL